MTIERASEIVSALRQSRSGDGMHAIDLFEFFVNQLHIEDTESFAGLCGYMIATNVQRVE